MEKLYSYRSGSRWMLLSIFASIALVVLILYQLFIGGQHKTVSYYFNDVFQSLRIEAFIDASFTISPNLQYLTQTSTMEQTKGMNSTLLITSLFFPVLSYSMSDQIMLQAGITEIYPFLAPVEKEENFVDSFDGDERFEYVHQAEEAAASQIMAYSMEDLMNYDFLISNIYTIDPYVKVSPSDFDPEYFLSRDISIDMNSDGPKILIYHTHSQEAFVDSTPGDKSDTIVGVGDELERILEQEYGIEVLHHYGEYDLINGVLDRSKAYELILPELKKILAENPSIEVMIDLHRDGVGNNVHLVTEIDGRPTAKIMFFNGLSKIMVDGEMVMLDSVQNPYVKENMAFSFQMHMTAASLYPKLTRRIYIKGPRYNLHLMPNSLLIEVGAQTNTVEEAKNAMIPLAKILYEVIK